MGLETGTYINSLVSTNPLGSDERSKGDDHIRLVKATIKASFPDVDEAVVTIHNGTSAPSTPQTGTVWRDTTNSLWKFYNGSGWITLAVSFSASNSVDVNAGTIDGITLGTNSAVTEAQIDNININGNAIISSDTDGDITITPNGAGEIILDGQKWPQADGSNTNYLTTNGSGQIAWTTNTVVTSETNAATSATTATTQAGIATAKAVLTAADAVSTAADVVSTNADVVSTNADVVLTEASTGAVAFKFTYDSTTSMANPTGTGGVRFDNATIASITNIAFDAVTADTGNPDISPLLLSIDDGSNDTHEGYIFIRKSGDLSTYIAFNVTGTVVDNTSWLQVPCSHSSSNGSISNGDTFYMSFVRSGNVGATGATGPSGGVGNELADNVFRIQDNSDATKEIAFEASGISSGTTRTITMPDSNVTLGTPNNNTVDETKLKDAFVADFTEVTVATGDSILLGDATDSGNTKRDTVAGIIDLVHGATVGLQTIWIPAKAMTPTNSNPCADIAVVETTAGRPDMHVLDFDKDADEGAQFEIAFPKSWDEGVVKFQVMWAGLAATTGVAWGLSGVSVPDNSTIDVAYGTAVVVTDDAQGAVEEMLVSPLSGDVTVAGAAVDTTTFFRIYRDVSDGNDDMAGDARLLGVKLFFTTDAENDA